MKRLPKSLRKFIRLQKSRIRREAFNPQDAEAKIRQLVEGIYKRYTEVEHKK